MQQGGVLPDFMLEFTLSEIMSAEHGGHGGGHGGGEGFFFIDGIAEPAAPVWEFLFDFLPNLLFGWLLAAT